MTKPSDIRRLLLEAHEALRGDLAKVRAAAEGASAGPLLAAMHILLRAIRAHLDREHALLVPTLAQIDAWGPHRAERLERDLETERAWIASAERWASQSGLSFTDIRRKALDFVALVEAQLAVEEHRDLRPDLLTEYPFPIDFGGV
ncbi:MAG: hypothetical protein K8H88_34410 [Sandaracinaceae bacterium]|nr:hypothetical protein [Sandaracinaceae bacterium]